MLESIKEKVNQEAKKSVFGKETVDSELDQGWMEMTKNSLIEKALTLVGLKSLAEARKAKRLKTTSKETKKTDDKTDEKGEKTPLYSGAENQTEINKEGLTEEQIKLIDQLQSAKKTANLTVKMAKFADPTEAMASLFPGLGDGGASVSLGVFYHSLGMSVGFNKKQHASITRILAKDFAAGLIPVVGDIADFVYKGCKKIGRIFDKHFKTLSTDSEGKLPADILEKIKNDKTIDKKLLAKIIKGTAMGIGEVFMGPINGLFVRPFKKIIVEPTKKYVIEPTKKYIIEPVKELLGVEPTLAKAGKVVSIDSAEKIKKAA